MAYIDKCAWVHDILYTLLAIMVFQVVYSQLITKVNLTLIFTCNNPNPNPSLNPNKF